MKKYIFLLALLFCATRAFAQTQNGYVKTRGRLDAYGNLIPGQGLKGATVQIKGMTSLLVKGDDGSFSFPLIEKQYIIESVQKKGYQLVDASVCHKTYEYSSTPIDILMEIPEKQKEDYIADFNRINASQQAMIDNLRKEVEQLKNRNKINEEEYNRRLIEIAERQTTSQKLVSEMAERYSKMDFDRLDDFERKISWLILNGDLIKADSLIKSKGNMEKRSSDLDQLHKANMEVRADLEKSELYEAKMREDFATDCYNLYEICMLRCESDSASYWLELRASKDTTNIEWQLEAGGFLDSYLADYDRALSYFYLALRNSMLENSGENSWTAICYDNIGLVYAKIGKYSMAVEYYENALNIFKSLIGEDNSLVATIYNNMGSALEGQGLLDLALEQYDKTLTIQKRVLEENHPEVARTYDNISVVYIKESYYEKALEYLEKAKGIYKSVFSDENHLELAQCYNKMGVAYSYQENFVKAMECHEKALAIRKTILNKNHPDIAESYSNIGSVYAGLEDYDKALKYYQQALDIDMPLLGENHPSVNIIIDNINHVKEMMIIKE